MAPVCLPSHLPVIKFFSVYCRDATLLVYNRQALFIIPVSWEALTLSLDLLRQHTQSLPPVNIPTDILQLPPGLPLKK